MNGPEISYRGCKIYKTLDHRGRTQWWISVPGRLGDLQLACKSVEDGKASIDEHLAKGKGNRNDLTVPVGLVLMLAVFIALFFGVGRG